MQAFGTHGDIARPASRRTLWVLRGGSNPAAKGADRTPAPVAS